jgi:O-antigen/teichoic acid export membrane protein
MTLLPRRVLTLASWTTGAWGLGQVLRIGTSVVLTRLLAPELFGIMLIVNTIRTGAALLMDVGIAQSVISNKHADEKDFYDTAWTLQFAQCALLTAVCTAAAFPVAFIYEAPIIATILPVASLAFAIAGAGSTARYLVQRRLQLKRLSIFDMVTLIVSSAAQILFAWLTPTVWSLVLGNLFATIAGTVASYFLIPGVRHRFFISRDYARQIFSFGKWVVLSSGVIYLSGNLDRLYLAEALPLALLGVYGIARSLADMLTSLVVTLGNSLIFPSVAKSDLSRQELRARLNRLRGTSLFAAAIGISFFAAVSGAIIEFVYDERYHAAGAMLPLLCLGVWFAVLCTLSESVFLGIGRPAYGAIANGAKLAWLCVALPLGVAWFGLTGALLGLAAGEAVRYVALSVYKVREGLSFAGQDLLMTLLGLGTFLLCRWILFPADPFAFMLT